MMLHAAQIDGTLQFLRFHGMPLKQPSFVILASGKGKQEQYARLFLAG